MDSLKALDPLPHVHSRRTSAIMQHPLTVLRHLCRNALVLGACLVTLSPASVLGAITTYPPGLRLLDSQSTQSIPPILLERSFAESEGYHRTLVTQVTINDAEDLPDTRCSLLLRETLPRTLYFDLYQLADLYRFHRAAYHAAPSPTYPESIVRVYSEQDVELERSAEDSSAYTIWLFVPHAQWSTTTSADGVQQNMATVKLPIHARYQAARPGGGHAEATMAPPVIYLRCDGVKHFSTTGWIRQKYVRESELTVRLQVPVGDLNDLALVRTGTFVVTVSASLALCFLVWWQARKSMPSTASGLDRPTDKSA